MKCFIAIQADEEIKNSLVKYQDEFFSTPRTTDYKEQKKDGKSVHVAKAPFRRTKKDHLHLTLFFLGNDVNPILVKRLIPVLQKVAGKTTAFEMECVGFGAFPKSTNAHSLFARLKSDNLEYLIRLIKDKFEHFDFDIKKKFNPHVTIARNREGGNASEFVNKYADEKWSQTNWKVNRLCLFESVQGDNGYEHKIIAEYKLA